MTLKHIQHNIHNPLKKEKYRYFQCSLLPVIYFLFCSFVFVTGILSYYKLQQTLFTLKTDTNLDNSIIEPKQNKSEM